MALSTAVLDRTAAAVRAWDGADIGSLARPDLLAAHDALGQVRRAVDALLIGVAGEIARRSEEQAGPGGFARREGFASPHMLIASTLGITPSEAGRMINVGKAIAVEEVRDEVDGAPVAAPAPKYPHVAEAIESGELSVDKAALITKTLDSLPATVVATERGHVERGLVASAGRLGLRDLKAACRRAWARANPAGLEELEQKLHRERKLSFIDGDFGMTIMHAELDPLSAAPIKAWMEAQVRAEFRTRRQQHEDKVDAAFIDKRTAPQIRVDMLVMLARHGMDCEETGSGVKTTVVVRIDKDQLESQLGVGECDDLQMPISARTLRRLAVDAAILPMVMGGESLPLDLGRSKRLHTWAQRLAVIERDGGCAYCHAPPSYSEMHHIKWWRRDGGRTDLANAVMLCVSCHHRIHDDDWGIDIVDGQVWFTPPAHIDRQRRPILGGLAALDPPRLAVSA